MLSKSDLADPEVTTLWLKHLEQTAPPRGSGPVLAVAITTAREAETRTRIANACGALAKPTRGRKTARAMIVGIPNVGKSTLVNTLAQRKIANVGDVPAVTKGKHIVELKNGMTISDNPGIMWPKIEDPIGGLRLAFGGAIPDGALVRFSMFDAEPQVAWRGLEAFARLLVASAGPELRRILVGSR